MKPEFNYEKLHSMTKIVTENLNKVIDINFYPTEKTKRSNFLHRPIGIGVQGLADTFALMNIPFYSDDGFWYAEFPVYDQDQNLTHVIIIDFPPNGEDRALVFSETQMMVNFTSHDPQMYLVDLGTGQAYSNWCEVDRSGLYKGRGNTEYAIKPDNPNVYWWGPNAPVTGDDNYIFHMKATLYRNFANHFCATDLTESVDFSYTYQGQNGKIRQTSSIK